MRDGARNLLRISLFGPAAIEIDGRALAVDTRKAVALLAYLAVQGQTQAREHLAGLLWPDYDQERARAALRRTLSALRKALGDRWLRTDRTKVTLEHDGVSCDIWDFNRCLGEAKAHDHEEGEVCESCMTALGEATSLAGSGEILSGFVLRDSPDFEDWLFTATQALIRENSRALERLGSFLVATGDLEGAIEVTQRWIALDPLHEPAHRRLMRLHAWSGNRNAALEHYRDCVGLLEKELGVAPLEETTKLYEAVREDRLEPGSAPSAEARMSGKPEVHSVERFPLVGRGSDFQTLLETYLAGTERHEVMVIEGEAGIGKTALATELAERVSSLGSTVVAVRLYEEEQGFAYGATAQALRSAVESGADLLDVADEWRSEAARLVPEIDAPRMAPQTDPGAQARFLEGAARCLAAALGSDPPGLLLLDDAQWADPSTLDVLSFLVRRIEGRARLLFTFRTEEVGPEHRLRKLVEGLDTETTHVRLGRLDRPEITQLVQSIAPAASARDPELVQRLMEETEGVPYFIVEYLATMKDGAIQDWSVPPSVRELVLRRIRACSELGAQVLAAAAAIGRSFDFDRLRAASGRSEEETVVALEELGDRQLVAEIASESASPTYDFVHEKVREVAYSSTSFARRRILHGRIADATRTRAGNPGIVAQHLLAAGRDAEAADMFQAAGRQAASLYANGEARDHFLTALALGHPENATIHEALGDLDTLAGAYGDAITRYETAAALGSGARIPVLERKLAEVHIRLGDYAAADSHLEAALDTLEPGDADLARILADRSLVSARSGEEAAARSLADRSLQEAQRNGDGGALAQAHNLLGILDKRAGDPDSSVAHLEKSLAIATELEDETAQAAALNNLALALGDQGDTQRAMDRAKAALQLCVRLGDRHREAALHSNIADLLHTTGRKEEALTHLKQGAAILAEVGEPGVMHPEVFKLTEW